MKKVCISCVVSFILTLFVTPQVSAFGIFGCMKEARNRQAIILRPVFDRPVFDQPVFDGKIRERVRQRTRNTARVTVNVVSRILPRNW